MSGAISIGSFLGHANGGVAKSTSTWITGKIGRKSLTQVPGGTAKISSPLSAPPHVDSGVPRIQLSGRLQQVLTDFKAGGSPCLTNRCGTRVMSETDFITLVGHPPKETRFFGLKNMSGHYKAVVAGLQGYHKALNHEIPKSPKAAVYDAKGMIDSLNDLHKSAKEYIEKHEGNSSDPKAVDAMKTLQEEIKKEIALIKEVAGKANAGQLKGMTWGQALTGANYRLLDTISQHHDGLLDLSKSVESFGAGAANQVSKLVYNTPQGVKETVFKPDPERENSESFRTGTLFFLGINPDKPCYAARNVATAFISESLGLGVAPHCGIALHNGKIGMAMDLAQGKSLQRNVDVPMTAQSLANYTAIGQGSEESLKALNYTNKNGVWVKTETKLEISKIFKGDKEIEANFQKEASKLEWMDAICGQYDRHPGNYLVDVDPVTKQVTITGIDNDFCFGTKPEKVDGKFGQCIGLPQLIDKDTAARLKATDFDRDLAPTLGTLISSDELSAAKSRFTQLQRYALELEENGKVVDNWQTWPGQKGKSVETFLKEEAPKDSSYYTRELMSEKASAHIH